jgi:hypothetical protein
MLQPPPLPMESRHSSGWLHRKTFSRMSLASPTESATTDASRGDGRLMSSRANRTAAIMAAAITRVEANRSVIHFCSSITLVRSSLAIARFITPIFASISLNGPAFATTERIVVRERCPTVGSTGARRTEDTSR